MTDLLEQLRRVCRKRKWSEIEAECEAKWRSLGLDAEDVRRMNDAVGFEIWPLDLPDYFPRARPIPHWDGGTLWFDGRVARRFTKAAPNLRKLLDGFEELGWPHMLEDPLVGGDVDPRNRLEDAVRGLNRGNSLIRFRLDGTGQGIIWEPRR